MAVPSQQINKILVALDGSSPARNAADMAIQISQNQGWTIEGLYIVDALVILGQAAFSQGDLGDVVAPSSPDQLLSAFESHGDRECRWLEECCQAAGVPASTHMIMGGIKEMVEQKAEQAGMIALGRRGNRHALDSKYLGDNFQVIAHHTRLPLLVGGDDQRPLRRLLLAYDASPRASHALEWAVRLQQTMACDISVIVVQEHPKDLQHAEAIKAALDQSAMTSWQLLERRGQPAAEIVAAAAETHSDLIIMGGYHHSALLEWFTGSTLDLVLRGSPLATLVA